MSTPMKTMSFASAAVLTALMSFMPAGEAAPRRDGMHGNNHAGNPGTHNRRMGNVRNFGGQHHSSRNYRRHNRNGLRLVVPGLSIYSNSGSGGCSYSYRKWQATGSRYWRERYYDCRSG